MKVSKLVRTALAVAVIAVPAAHGQAQRAPAVPAASSYDVMEKSIEELQRAMAAREVTSRQLVDLYLARIEAYDKQGPALNAVVALNPQARATADALDAERSRRGARGPLHGIPIVVKDNYETIEMPTSAGSIALASFHPARDAFMVQRLKTAGAVIVGKTNMHELAAGIFTAGSRFGQTKNPYDLDRNPGGSSGGTGAAIAANFAASGMGSDTCGSIRNPASHNNLVGLRGTQGLSSRTGIVPLSSTQDIGGPIARSIVDLALMLDATVGADPADASTAASAGRIPASYRAGLRADALRGARIGIVRGLFGTAPEDQEVSTVVQKAIDALKKAGADTLDVTIPGLDDLLRDSSMINAEFKFDLADYLAKSDHPPVKSLGEILDRGLYHTALESTFRLRNAPEQRETDAARRARIKQTALRQAVDGVLQGDRVVALLYPTLRRKPARIGDGQGGSTCQLSAHSGLPALSVPAGFTEDGMPIGMDMLGAAFTEQELLSLGFAIEETRHFRRTPFSTPALVAGARPAPRSTIVTFAGISAKLTFDETTSRLQYALSGDAASLDRLSAVWVHSGTAAKPGAARHQLYGPVQPAVGSVTLAYADRRDLAEGRLMLRFYARDGRGATGDATIAFATDAKFK